MVLNIIEILFLFVLPVLLLYFKKINFKYRIYVLSFISIITFIIILLEKWDLKKIGVRLDNIKNSIFPYMIFTIMGVILLIFISKLLKNKPDKNFYKQKHFIFGFLILSILQEFLFRGFLIVKLSEIMNPSILIILVNALLFTFMHIIYFNKKSIIILLFLSGIVFAYLYLNYPNLIIISISHSILNYVAVMFGYFSEEKNNKMLL